MLPFPMFSALLGIISIIQYYIITIILISFTSIVMDATAIITVSWQYKIST